MTLTRLPAATREHQQAISLIDQQAGRADRPGPHQGREEIEGRGRVALAKAAGRDVGELEYVAEVAPTSTATDYNESSGTLDSAFALAVPASAVRGSIPISPGEQKLSVTVQARAVPRLRDQ